MGYWIVWVLLIGGSFLFPRLGLAAESSPHALVDFTRYFPTTPGLVFTFRAVDHPTGTVGQTQIELEAETSWCGVRIRPWRFTKTAAQIYWAPGLEWDLRWYLVAEDPPDAPSWWHNYVWAVGDQRFARTGSLELGTRVVQSVIYRSVSGYPPYLLGVKQVRLPFESHDDTGQRYLVPPDALGCPQPVAPLDSPGIAYGWRVRMDWATLPVPALGATVPAIRVDYWEGRAGMLETAPSLLRESWYFVKDVGLVEIRTKHFTQESRLPCLVDPDCHQADIQAPEETLTLLQRTWHSPRTFPVE